MRDAQAAAAGGAHQVQVPVWLHLQRVPQGRNKPAVSTSRGCWLGRGADLQGQDPIAKAPKLGRR